MKRYLLFFILILFILPALAKVEKTEIAVKGMNCATCADIVGNALKEAQGVSDVKVSFEKGIATVEYNSEKTDVTALEGVIAAAGFDAGTAKAKEPHKCSDKECSKTAKAGCGADDKKSGCPASKCGGCPSGKK